MDFTEQEKLTSTMKNWRGGCVMLGCIMLFIIFCQVLHDTAAPNWGYTGWEKGPRILFNEEVKCWRHLANARKTNEYLLTQDCTPEKE